MLPGHWPLWSQIPSRGKRHQSLCCDRWCPPGQLDQSVNSERDKQWPWLWLWPVLVYCKHVLSGNHGNWPNSWQCASDCSVPLLWKSGSPPPVAVDRLTFWELMDGCQSCHLLHAWLCGSDALLQQMKRVLMLIFLTLAPSPFVIFLPWGFFSL